MDTLQRHNSFVAPQLFTKKIAESVLYSQSAKELWSDLEDRFGQTTGAKSFQLQKELSIVVQGNSSISSYFTKIKSL